MRKKNIIGFLLAFVMLLSICTSSFGVYAEESRDAEEPAVENKVASAEAVDGEKKIYAEKEIDAEQPEDPQEEDIVKEPEEAEKKVDKLGEAEEVIKEKEKTATIEENERLELSKEEVPEAVGEPAAEKTFTVTKRTMGSTEKGELVGNYDTFYEAVKNCKQEDLTNEYVITMNRDYDIPETESMWGKSKVNILLKSKEGNQFTLKRSNKNFISLYSNATLKVENIKLNGDKKAQAVGVTGGTLTLGNGAVVENCTGYQGFDGPAILVSSNGTLNIEEGATIQGNYSNQQGGAIQARNESTINISGGTFKNNKSNTSDGGVIAAYGTINITGGTFEGNSSNKVGGAILIGSRATASITGASFNKNRASTGGAVYASKDISITETVFEGNDAKWGGAVFASKKLTLKNSSLKNNNVASAGGALYLQGGADINKTNFIENTADRNGGAIYIKKGDSNITECEFTKNGIQAIFIDHDDNGITKISNTKFTENYSTSFGGGIYLGLNSKLDLARSTFTKNKAAYGAGIASAGTGNVDTSLTKIKVDSCTFTDNLSLMGAGIYTAFPTEINNCTFNKNKADIHPQDDQSNPHDSGVGGAVEVIDNKTTIKASTFEENWAYGSGGAIGINGVARDKVKNITTIKPNIKVEISDDTKFIGNICNVGQGGAIFTIPYLYDIEGYETGVDKETLKAKAYQNLSIANDTIFKDNLALSGFVDPPENYKDYTDLKFKTNSFTDVLPDKDVAKSLLNNYDVNYKNAKLSAFFDPNGGEFTEGANPKDIRVLTDKKDAEITLLDAPKRDGYKFLGWKCSMNIPDDIFKELPKELIEKLKEGKIYQAGDKFKLDADYIFIAQWEKEIPPEPKPEPKPEVEPRRHEYVDTISVIAKVPDKESYLHMSYLFGYPDKTIRPEGNMTRAEALAVVTRLEGYSFKDDSAKVFKDMKKGAWYNKYINAAFEHGILVEKEGEDFRPDQAITRAEFAKLISFIDKDNSKVAPFADVKGHVYEDAINKAYGNDRIKGYPDGTFRPDAKITRAEIVTILNNFYDRKADSESLKNVKNIENLKQFKDLSEGYWAYYEITEAANSHEYVRRSGGLVENWIRIIEDLVK